MIQTSNCRPVPEETMILGEGQYYSMNCYQTQLNNNAIIIGTSGAGKTRSIVRPNLLRATGSYVVSDPKGVLAKEIGPYLRSCGYRVVEMDFMHPEKSLKYNPITKVHSTEDVSKLVHMIVREERGRNSSADPFWDCAAKMLFNTILGYLYETDEYEECEKNFSLVSSLICEANEPEDAPDDGQFIPLHNLRSKLEARMDRHAQVMRAKGKESWAYHRFREFATAPEKTYRTIIITALAKLITFDTEELRCMLKGNDIDFTSIGRVPSAVFVEVSDTDRSKDALVNLFYSQMMSELCSYADDKCVGNRLPVSVQFLLDDFATNAHIDNFENMISNIRSRGISAMIMVQSEAQLEAGYGVHAHTIVDNCSSYVFMGGSDPAMAEIVAKKANKSPSTILNMPVGTSWIFRRGEEPVMCNNFDLASFEKEKGFVTGQPQQRIDSPELFMYTN